MRMRFWPTMRRPAFSISAFTAPVRLRAVASGLMIEKVRSVAILVLKLTGCGGGRAYIGDPLVRQAPTDSADPRKCPRFQRFHCGPPIEELLMFHKRRLAALVVIALGLFVSRPALAADLGAGGPYHGACPHVFNGLPVSFGYGLCYQRVLVQTPWGPRWRLVNQCC